jgi:hypothetical protein
MNITSSLVDEFNELNGVDILDYYAAQISNPFETNELNDKHTEQSNFSAESSAVEIVLLSNSGRCLVLSNPDDTSVASDIEMYDYIITHHIKLLFLLILT